MPEDIKTRAVAALTDVEAQRIVAVVNLAISKFDTLCALFKKEIPCEHDLESVLISDVLRNIFRSNLSTSDRSLKPIAITDDESYLRQLFQSTRWLMIERMTRSLQDEEANRVELTRATDRERKIAEDVFVLKQQLEKARKLREADIGAKNLIISKLKDQLKSIKQASEEVTQKLDSRAKAKEETEVGAFNVKKELASKQISTLSSELNKLISEHREEETQLRKKMQKVESEVEAWIQKYDQDMDEKQNEIDEINSLYKDEKEQLSELRKRYSLLEAEFAKSKEYHNLANDLKKRREAQIKRKEIAATKIQALIRGFKIRKQLKEQKEKKKKSAKPKKKKKK